MEQFLQFIKFHSTQIKWFVYILALAGIVYFFQKNITQAHLTLLYNNISIFIGLVFITIISYVAAAIVWLEGVRFGSGKKVSFMEVLYVYFNSSIAKYLPGNFMHFVGRNVLGLQLGISQITMGLSTIVEQSISFLVSFCFVFLFYRIGYINIPINLPNLRSVYLAIPIVLGIGVAIFFLLKNKLILFAKSLLSYSASDFVEYLFKVFFLSLNGLLVYLVVSYCVVYMCLGSQLSFVQTFDVILILIASAYLGMIPLGMPGGIGVREAFSIYLLTLYHIDVKDATFISVVLRVISICADVLVFLCSFLFRSRKFDYAPQN